MLIVIGMSGVLLKKPLLGEVIYTHDVDVLTTLTEDVDEIYYTIEDLRRTGRLKGDVYVRKDLIVQYQPLMDEPSRPIDFIHPSGIHQGLFKHTENNARVKLCTIVDTEIFVGEVEDCLLCKAAVGRPTDIEALNKVIPTLDGKGEINWDYFWSTAEKYSESENVQKTFEEVGLQKYIPH